MINNLEFRKRVSARLNAEAQVLSEFANHRNPAGHLCPAASVQFKVLDTRWIDEHVIVSCVVSCSSCAGFKYRGLIIAERNKAPNVVHSPDSFQAFYPLSVIRG